MFDIKNQNEISDLTTAYQRLKLHVDATLKYSAYSVVDLGKLFSGFFPKSWNTWERNIRIAHWYCKKQCTFRNRFKATSETLVIVILWHFSCSLFSLKWIKGSHNPLLKFQILSPLYFFYIMFTDLFLWKNRSHHYQRETKVWQDFQVSSGLISWSESLTLFISFHVTNFSWKFISQAYNYFHLQCFLW